MYVCLRNVLSPILYNNKKQQLNSFYFLFYIFLLLFMFIFLANQNGTILTIFIVFEGTLWGWFICGLLDIKTFWMPFFLSVLQNKKTY